MNRLRTWLQIGRMFGLRDGALRLGYELQRSSGLMKRRMRGAGGWEHWNLGRIAPKATAQDLLQARREGVRAFFFADARTLTSRLRQSVGGQGENRILREAENILRGDLPFFGHLSFACGFPPHWFENSATGQHVSPDRPWTNMRFAGPDYGDLKFILEPSRFLFSYSLVRAYVLSGDDRFPRAFWIAIEDWARKNPPMLGPMWICGQEASLRILAWSFALQAFIHSPTTTAERVALLTSMIAAHAWRAEQTIGYARSQRSNHLISEAVGLWTVGTIFPELEYAKSWQALGVELLREAVPDQITPEGVHLQHSFTYQRMVLHLLLWTLRLAALYHIRLPAEIVTRTAAAFDFLRAFVDPISGHAPNYGANDGSLILPLSVCDTGDFRPLIQLGASVLGRPALQPGPWDEARIWLCGESVATAETDEWLSSQPTANSGYHRLGTRDSWALIRAGRYIRRPFQADQLHCDVWHHGVNLLRDAGTYLYNGEPPWDNGLARTVVHNTVMIDGQDQMRRVGRFLWIDWAQAKGRSFSSNNGSPPDTFEGEHDGYKRLGVTHRRMVRYLTDVCWIVEDDILGTGEHDVRLQWLVPDLSIEKVIHNPRHVLLSAKLPGLCWDILSSAPGEVALVRAGKSSNPEVVGDDGEILGWDSPTYGELRASVSVICRTKAPLPVRLVTVIRVDEDLLLESDGDQVVLRKGGSEIHRVCTIPDEES